MKTVKFMLAINGVTLAINGIIVWLTVAKEFPALLGILLVFGFIAGAVWLSCYVNGVLPSQRQRASFYSAPTEKVETV